MLYLLLNQKGDIMGRFLSEHRALNYLEELNKRGYKYIKFQPMTKKQYNKYCRKVLGLRVDTYV